MVLLTSASRVVTRAAVSLPLALNWLIVMGWNTSLALFGSRALSLAHTRHEPGCAFFSAHTVSRRAHACWCLSTLTQCQACENASLLQLWLRAKVSLNNGCQGCPVEDSPLAGDLAVTHVAVPLFVYLNTTRGNMPASLLPAAFYPRGRCLHSE